MKKYQKLKWGCFNGEGEYRFGAGPRNSDLNYKVYGYKPTTDRQELIPVLYNY